MKFCKDCKHAKRLWAAGWVCHRPRECIDLVTGEPKHMHTSACDIQRACEATGCGEAARFFQPREAAHE